MLFYSFVGMRVSPTIWKKSQTYQQHLIFIDFCIRSFACIGWIRIWNFSDMVLKHQTKQDKLMRAVLEFEVVTVTSFVSLGFERYKT